MTDPYCPRRGDVVWLRYNPRVGHEQSGVRPAVTLSPEPYNKKVGLALFCPITSQIKGYPFEVNIPDGLKVSGAILSDQIRSLDWRARESKFFCRIPESTLQEITDKIRSLLILP